MVRLRVYIYMYICKHTHIPHTYIYIPTYLHTYLRTFLHTYLPTYLPAYLPTYLPTQVRAYIHTYIHTYINTYIHTYIHTYITYIRTYLHVRVWVCGPVCVCVLYVDRYCIDLNSQVHKLTNSTHRSKARVWRGQSQREKQQHSFGSRIAHPRGLH